MQKSNFDIYFQKFQKQNQAYELSRTKKIRTGIVSLVIEGSSMAPDAILPELCRR